MGDNLYKIIVTVILHKSSDNFSNTVYSFSKVSTSICHKLLCTLSASILCNTLLQFHV